MSYIQNRSLAGSRTAFAIAALSLGGPALAANAPAQAPEAMHSGAPTVASPCPVPYPTSVLADYVLGCMIASGQSPETLRKCSCSIDFIAAAIPYEEYERVETLMRLQQTEGTGRNAAYKGAAWAKDAVTHFKEVQAESTLRCF